MAHIVKLGPRTFEANMVLQPSGAKLGSHESTMLGEVVDNHRGWIEWDIPAIETTEVIGLWFETRSEGYALIDYDGLHALPAEAVALLRDAGYIVDADFE